MWNPFSHRASERSNLPAADETVAPTEAPSWLGGGRSAVPPQPGAASAAAAPHEQAPAAAPDASGPAHGGEPAATRSRIAAVEIIGHTAVATITATDLTQEQGSRELAELLQELDATGALNFVLDMDAVQFMDSACLGCLVEALNRLGTRGGRIALANSNHSVHYIFRLTRLDRVFSICSDVMGALQAVEGTNIRLR